MNLIYTLEIYGNYRQNKKNVTIAPDVNVPKYCDIYFTATTNTPRPFEVYWQVVNTGHQAESLNALRGEFLNLKLSV